VKSDDGQRSLPGKPMVASILPEIDWTVVGMVIGLVISMIAILWYVRGRH
jgi:hypothetical protein